ncbi:unnamed protein product [Rhizopus stolonifer]
MSKINFSTHGKDIQAAYDAVIQKSQDWLIYAFDKGTYDLRVQATGDDGLEGLTDEFCMEKYNLLLLKSKTQILNFPSLSLSPGVEAVYQNYAKHFLILNSMKFLNSSRVSMFKLMLEMRRT